MDCGRAGRPSADGRLRDYTLSECNVLGGEFRGNGECLRTTGGSFSYDCRALNDEPLDYVLRNKYLIGGALLVGVLVVWKVMK